MDTDDLILSSLGGCLRAGLVECRTGLVDRGETTFELVFGDVDVELEAHEDGELHLVEVLERDAQKLGQLHVDALPVNFAQAFVGKSIGDGQKSAQKQPVSELFIIQ